MQGLSIKPSTKLQLSSLLVAVAVVMLVLLAGVAHGGGRRLVVSSREDEPCKKMTVYYHDILYNGNNTANATAAAVTKPVAALTPERTNGTFGLLVVFDDLVTEEQALSSEPVARAQGFYFYDKKEEDNAWFAFSLVFNSTAYRGTLNLIGPDLIAEKTRDLSVGGGTGTSSWRGASPRCGPTPLRASTTSGS